MKLASYRYGKRDRYGAVIESRSPDWLKLGEMLEIEISGIGTLANPIEAE